MQELKFTLLRWAAWAPGLETIADWQGWAQGEVAINDDGSSPQLSFIAPMLRRRFSRLTRMALQACYQCLESADLEEPHTVRTIFCSRHGEIHRTKSLLDELVRAEPISPMGFSLSVHNTASGLYSIASGNRAASSAIAAGVDTLEMALIDALGHLQRQPAQPVLVVLADEPLPAFYQPYDTEQMAPHALALLLQASESSQQRAHSGEQLTLAASTLAGNRAKDSTGHASEYGGLAHGLAVARWLCREETECILPGERLRWHWHREHGAANG